MSIAIANAEGKGGETIPSMALRIIKALNTACSRFLKKKPSTTNETTAKPGKTGLAPAANPAIKPIIITPNQMARAEKLIER